eukprot:COSAG05_NODE_22996_length_261_cov_0.617284_1_plen_52_part_01
MRTKETKVVVFNASLWPSMVAQPHGEPAVSILGSVHTDRDLPMSRLRLSRNR